MIDQAMVNDIRALLRTDMRLGMDAEMQGIEIIYSIAQTFNHRSEESPQSIRLIAAFNLCNPAVLYGQSNRFIEVRRDADIP